MFGITGRAVIVLSIALASPGMAQSNWRFAAGAGYLSWDASGTGESATFVARADRDLGRRWLAIELGGAFTALDEQSLGASTKTLAADAQLQLQAPWTRVQPYAGVGPSLFSYLTRAGRRDRVEPGYNVGGGVRAQFTRRVGAVFDARIRGWDFEGATNFTVNVGGEMTLSLTLQP